MGFESTVGMLSLMRFLPFSSLIGGKTVPGPNLSAVFVSHGTSSENSILSSYDFESF